MTQPLARRGRTAAMKMLAAQAVILALSILLALIDSVETATAIALGGLAYLLPQSLFSWKAFKHSGAQAARSVLRAFYLGEALKLIVASALLVLVFLTAPVPPTAILVGFAILVMSQWLVPWLIKA